MHACKTGLRGPDPDRDPDSIFGWLKEPANNFMRISHILIRSI